MVKSKKTSKKPRGSRGRGRQEGNSGPGIDADYYSGPMLSTSRIKGLSTMDVVLCDNVNVSATAGGLYTTVFSSDPTTMTQWAAASGNSDGYRVLALSVTFSPINKRNQTLSVAYGAGVANCYVVLDYNSTVALTTQQVAAEFESCEIHSFSDNWSRKIDAEDRELMAWTDTNVAPSRLMSIKTYSTGNFASIALGNCLVRRLVQFRSMV